MLKKKTGIFFTSICYFYNLVGCNYLINEEHLITNLYHNGERNVLSFSNKWIVKTHYDEAAEKIAKNKGFHYGGGIEDFKNYHLFEKYDHPREHYEESCHHTRELTDHENIVWARQLFHRRLHKRDFQSDSRDIRGHLDDNIITNLREKKLKAIQKSLFERSLTGKTTETNAFDFTSLYDEEFSDELWTLQWYELGYRLNSTIPMIDMNLVPVYQKYNITGAGVKILIIDDGIEYTHEDIRCNFDEQISYNLNTNNPDVMPRYEDPRNRHGTRCAGVIVMKANNRKCGVGIAFNAKVGGITLLDGVTDDLMEAKAIKYANDRVDIYSGSWGPQDNGQTLDGPGHLASLAFYHGVTKGRNGLGSLYVFAAGNGGIFGDHCGADGYVNSIYSIAVASATHDGDLPFYAERCPAVIATAYSGSTADEVKIIATDIHNSCTLEHSGTSASAPLVAGVLGLVLEANRNVTWRDIQHLLVWSCEITSLKRDIDWSQNSAGLWFTPQFGFGLINAFKMVTLARDWKTVPEKFICSAPFELRNVNRVFTNYVAFVGTVFTDACGDSVRYLEHVQLNLTAKYAIRGHLEIVLISPSGTASTLMEPRKNDIVATTFVGWPFMSLQFWGESAAGTWTVMISDKVKKGSHRGRVESIQLILHGTRDIPDHYVNIPREYESFLI